MCGYMLFPCPQKSRKKRSGGKKEVLDTKEGGNRKPAVPSYAAQHLAGEGTQEQKNKGVAVPRMKGQLR